MGSAPDGRSALLIIMLGRAKLARRIVADAGEIGYTQMLLDTLPFLERAIAMYRALGFYKIPSYNDSPLERTIYMKLDL